MISIAFSIISISAFGQDYYPLIQEHNTWNVLSVSGAIFDTTYSTITYKLTGDTIINSKTYKKLYSTQEEQVVNWNLWGFMREDTDKKVWLRMPSDEEEFLAYDFSIGVGDSVLVGMNNTEYLRVDSISEIVINQSQRKKFWLSAINYPSYYKETWIEGIGSSKGICWSGSVLVVGGRFWLLCMYENEILTYINPNYESCYLITEINEIEDLSLEIYPNPAKNLLFIKNTENLTITSIALYNAKGQLIRQFDKMLDQFDISGISSGCYTFQIVTKTGLITRKLLIK